MSTASTNDIQTIFQTHALPLLGATLKSIFQETDKALLNLAVAAEGNHQQNYYFSAVQQLRIIYFDIIQQCQHCLIALLHNPSSLPTHDSEQQSSLRKLISRLPNKHQVELLSNGTANPVAANNIVNCFLYHLAQADLDSHSKMLVLRFFESQLEKDLADIQATSYQALSQLDIHATAQQSADSQALASDNQALLSALADLQAIHYENLDSLLALETLKQQFSPAETVDLVEQLQQHNLYTAEIAEQECSVIDTIQHLFNILLSDPKLSSTARYLLSLLQLPYTRIALHDFSFLQNEQNPAKSVLNEIIRLSAQWQAPEDLANDAFLQKLSHIITLFWEAERINQLSYQQILFDLLLYSEQNREQQQLINQRIEESQQSSAQSDIVREQVNAIIQEKFSGIRIPAPVQQLLDEGWKHVMLLVGLRYGMERESWHKTIDVLDQLVAATQPVNHYASRNDFLVLLPKLLKSLREGLSFIKIEPSMINTLFDDLESEHKRFALRINDSELDDQRLLQARESAAQFHLELGLEGVLSLPAEPIATVNEEPAATEPVIEIAPELQAAQNTLNNLGPGSNLIWHKDGTQQRCRIAAYIKHTQKYVLIQPNGSKLAELHADEFLQKILHNEIESLETGQIFERALETLIDKSRGLRT